MDGANSFAQVKLKEDVYIESPRGFGRKNKQDKVLKLNSSLYGLWQAPKTFFEKLREYSKERGFIQSQIDKCIFLNKDMICVVYIDATIVAGPASKKISDLITSLGLLENNGQLLLSSQREGKLVIFLEFESNIYQTIPSK